MDFPGKATGISVAGDIGDMRGRQPELEKLTERDSRAPELPRSSMPPCVIALSLPLATAGSMRVESGVES